MSNLPVRHQPSTVQPADNSQQPGSSRLSEAEVARLRGILAELETLQKSSQDAARTDRLAGLIKQIRDVIADELRGVINAQSPARQTDRPVASEPAATVSRDMITTGNIAPGAAVGEGTVTIHDGAAGRDNLRAGVIIQHADRVIFDGQAPPEDVQVSKMERDYLWWLITVANRVPLGDLDVQLGEAPGHSALEIHLDAIYVALDTLRMQAARRQADNPDDRVQVPALEAVIQHKRLMILGDPGSGKTTFINYLTLCLAGARLYPGRGYLDRLNVPGDGRRKAARWRHGPLLPIRINLREFVQGIPANARSGTVSMVWTHITEQLAALNLGGFAGEVEDALRRGSCLVMFDGLDEVSDTRQRQIVREAVETFADRYALNRFVATCRMLSYTNPKWQLTSFPAVTLAPLSQASIDTFIENWYNCLARMGQMNQRRARMKAGELRNASRKLYDLAQNPMLLTVMAVVHTYKGTLPRERARLYDDCVKLLLWQWQQTKRLASGEWEQGILDELGVREDQLASGLYEVAFRAHSAQSGKEHATNIPQSEVLRILQRHLDGDWGKAQRFCEYVERRAGLLIARRGPDESESSYAFIHRGFQEFLAGRYLIADRDFTRRAAALVAQGDAWHEVLLLAIGHMVYNQQNINLPLDAINLLCPSSPPKDEAGWRAVWWSAEMLSIVGRSAAERDEFVGRPLVPRVIEQTIRLVTGGHLTPIERAQAADALGLLGDPRPGVCTREPDLVRIEGGPFEMGPEGARFSVTLKPFLIARYPVTNAQFRMFIEDGGYRQTKYWTAAGREWRKRAINPAGYAYDPAWGGANRPVVGITWYEAVAYTNWLREKTGKPYRLLTEAEWERAAAGLDGRRKYPFGNRASDDSLNTREAGIGQTTAVGIFPQDRTDEGVCDLGGNVWEWCSSLAKEYPYCATDGREDLNASGSRISRGGAYDNMRRQVHCAQRRPVEPQTSVPLLGFRVARDV